jgi:hypothetical protein
VVGRDIGAAAAILATAPSLDCADAGYTEHRRSDGRGHLRG